MKKRSKKTNCLFCDFLHGRVKEHKKGYTFKILLQTKNTASFLSLDSPVDNDAHLLVVPRKHYENMHDIPNNIKHELIEQISKVGQFLNKYHRGYNILLNNGR